MTGYRDVLNTLLSAGFQAYLAGGCVRDTLLGRVLQIRKELK